MNYNIKKNLHELVVPTDPLPIWVALFVNQHTQTYVAPHWHSGIELSFTQTGVIDDFHIASRHFKTKTGRILVVNSQVIHGSSNRIQNFHTALGMIFPLDYVRRLYPNIISKEIKINDPDQFTNEQKIHYAELQGYLGEFIAIYESTDQFKYLLLQDLIDKILLTLLKYFTVNKRPEKERKIYIVNRLQFITQYVSKHYCERISLDVLAKKCNVSKNYLARFFKQKMEITVNTYINNVRAEHAHAEMLGGKTNLTDLALENGFSGVKAMNNSFKKLYGKTASQIKKKLKNK